MVVVWPPPSKVDAVIPIIEQAMENRKRFLDKMQKLVPSPSPSGVYTLFHHNLYVSERISDVKLLFTRLAENRRLLTELTQKEGQLRPKKRIYKKTLSKKLQTVVEKSHDMHHQMRFDMEALFIFGNLLLDHWAYLIAYLVGEKDPELFHFFRLADYLQKKGDKGLLEPLWDKHQKDMLWLLYQIRNYRNSFIEHVADPYQRGTSMKTYGDDFSLTSFTSPHLITEDEVRESVKKIKHLVPRWTKSPGTNWYTDHPRQLLEVTFFFIDEIKEKHQREDVWKAWKIVGGATFSYDMIAFRLMRFVSESTLTVLDIITQHPDKIRWGN
jgi:hypothetical protein